MTDTYERISIKGRRPIFLRNPHEVERVLGTFIEGIEVNRYGDEIRGRTFDERKHMILELAITKRVPYVMDKKYGELVKA